MRQWTFLLRPGLFPGINALLLRYVMDASRIVDRGAPHEPRDLVPTARPRELAGDVPDGGGAEALEDGEDLAAVSLVP
jgi:hypothetical protein